MYVNNTNKQTSFGMRSIKPVNIPDDVWGQISKYQDTMLKFGPNDCDCIIIQDNVTFIVGVMRKMKSGAYRLGATVGKCLTFDLIEKALKLMEQAQLRVPGEVANDKNYDAQLLEMACKQLHDIYKGRQKSTPNVVYQAGD